jgi:hypothetical protein
MLTSTSCGSFELIASDATLLFPCGTGVIASGTGTWKFISFTQFLTGSFSWSVST